MLGEKQNNSGMQRSMKIMTQNLDKNQSIEADTEIMLIELVYKDIKTIIINTFKR